MPVPVVMSTLKGSSTASRFMTAVMWLEVM